MKRIRILDEDDSRSCTKRVAVSHWYTGGVIRMCNCGGPTLRVFTDGRNDYAHCPQCHTTWNLTLEGALQLIEHEEKT